ncbi:DVL family [Musa troglodytarum]|uniref:DVL family n=1 Tax=Musa troglodytarum TaxID=320322 RepID=A0A9E7FZA5_9LILI|nr:DVL family [Musa troglodytarum]
MSVSAMAESRKCAVAQPRKARRGITGRCAALVKEQRARIYILRRCATMLLCCCTVHGTGFSCTISSVGRTGCIMAGVANGAMAGNRDERGSNLSVAVEDPDPV